MSYTLPEPIAWLHIHGNYTEAANRPLVVDEVGRGWCEAGLHTDMTVQAAYAAGVAEGRKVPEVWLVDSKVFSILFATEAQADAMIANGTPAMGMSKQRLDVVQPAPEPSHDL